MDPDMLRFVKWTAPAFYALGGFVALCAWAGWAWWPAGESPEVGAVAFGAVGTYAPALWLMAREPWRPAVALDILGFFLTLFAGGVLYIVFQNLVNALSAYQVANYNSGQFLALDLAAYTYGWLALPAIVAVSALIGLLLGAQKRKTGAARI